MHNVNQSEASPVEMQLELPSINVLRDHQDHSALPPSVRLGVNNIHIIAAVSARYGGGGGALHIVTQTVIVEANRDNVGCWATNQSEHNK